MKIVSFDLETTGLDLAKDDIVEIGAVCLGQTFQAYLQPAVLIRPEATNIHGITKSRQGPLMLGGSFLKTQSRTQGLIAFTRWLENISKGKGAVLVAHNCFGFDAPVLVNAFHKVGMRVPGVILGFADSLDLARSLRLPLPNHKLDTLMRFYLGVAQNEVHGALPDAQAVEDLILAFSGSV